MCVHCHEKSAGVVRDGQLADAARSGTPFFSIDTHTPTPVATQETIQFNTVSCRQPNMMSQYLPPPSSIPPQGRPFGLSLLPLDHHGHNFSPLTPISFLLRGALIYPRKVAITHPERNYQFTYEQWAARCLSLAFALKSHMDARTGRPWQKGDRVAILAPNCPLILDAYHGVLAAGGIVVPLNIRNTNEELAYVLNSSGASIVLVDYELVHLIDAGSSSSSRTIIVSKDSGGQDPSDAYEAFLARGRAAWDARQAQEMVDFGVEGSARLDWEILETVDELDSAALCYTSGTTGRPKGVLTNHRGCYLAATANAFEAGIGYDSVYLWVLPCFHATGWTFPWSCTLGFATQQMLRKVDPAKIWEAFFYCGITHYCGAPTVQISLVNHPSAKRLVNPIKVAVAASAPTADMLSKMEALNLLPVHVYGLTETHGPFTRRYAEPTWALLDSEDRARLMARQGHSFVTSEEVRVVRIVEDEDGGGRRPVVSKDGKRLVDVRRDGFEIGEVVLRGNLVMQGYFNDAAATAKALAPRGVTASWYLTGDLAVRHPGGEIEIRDRAKDIIISGGENISSLMVEFEIASHPAVLESCVVARPHPKWGQRGYAFVVLKQGQKATVDELKSYCKSRMSGFAVPQWIDIVEELPKVRIQGAEALEEDEEW